jgi:hypothetical protein
MVTGAVYRPAVVMVPVAAEPPERPFTCQVTAVFVVPETVAESCEVDPSLVAEAPLMETVICGVVGPLLVVPPEHPERPMKPASKTRTPKGARDAG